MSIVLEKSSYIITNIILSQRDSFTTEDIITEATNKNLKVDKERIISALNRLRDSGLINDYGNKYSLSSLMFE